ncbi:MAG TPA: hypothetical protein VH141_04420 [Pseudonocardia sp.]|nr:hypothetical protein [Pseudonocardia sp.]
MSAPPDGLAETLDGVGEVADAVLFEGYLLYPYRASASKNQLRWQFGVLTPRDWAERTAESWYSHTECLLEPAGGADDRLHVRLRFLRLRRRRVQRATGAGGPDGFVDVAELTVPDGTGGDTLHLPWDEGLPETVDTAVTLAELAGDPLRIPVELPGEQTEELLLGASGEVVGRLLRRSWPAHAQLVVGTEPVPGPYGALRLRLRVENLGAEPDDPDPGTEVPDPRPDREEALRHSLIAAHSILALSAGEFLSMTDPPEWARPAVAASVNEHTWPVLAGPGTRPRLVLSSPIILPDFPEIAPESPNQLFDGLENDEILTLRTLVLTDEEKREARATDPRAATLVDAVDSMPAEIFERLHGAIRSMSGPGVAAEVPAFGGAPTFGQVFATLDDGVPVYSDETGGKPWWDPAADSSVDPETDSVLIGDVPVAKGATVVLRPNGRADAQDLFLAGRPALVEAVLHDVDGDVHLAVSLLDDPGSEFQASHGRYRYFRPEEVEVSR